MIFVRVGKKDGVQLSDVGAEHLISEIWTGIDHDTYTIDFDHDTASKAGVFGVGRSADPAAAGYHRYAAAGTGAEECDEQWENIYISRVKNPLESGVISTKWYHRMPVLQVSGHRKLLSAIIPRLPGRPVYPSALHRVSGFQASAPQD